MSLAIDYCKELAKELRLNAVYLPGVNVKPGDVISFDEGNIFGPKPLGPFKKVTSLKELDIKMATESDKDPYSYVYASKKNVSVSFDAGANAADKAKGKLTVNFSKEGSTYLSAIDCIQTRFKDISTLDDKLSAYKTQLDWKHCFIVVAVTVAAKALIMQSNTSSALLEIEGDVKGLQPVPGGGVVELPDVNAQMKVSVNSYKDASFIKDWSDNVPVSFQLVRYKRRLLGGWDVKSARKELMVSEDDNFSIEIVDPLDLV